MASLVNKVYWAHNFGINTNHPSWLRRVENFWCTRLKVGDYDVFRVKYTCNEHRINMKIFSFCHRKNYLSQNDIVQQHNWHFCFLILSTPYWLQNYTFVVYSMYIRILSTVYCLILTFKMGRFAKAEEDEKVGRQILKVRNNRIRTGHGKPEKSWNLRVLFSRPRKSWNLIDDLWNFKFCLVD